MPKVVQHHNHVDIQVEAAESGNRDIRSSGNFVLAEIENETWREDDEARIKR